MKSESKKSMDFAYSKNQRERTTETIFIPICSEEARKNFHLLKNTLPVNTIDGKASDYGKEFTTFEFINKVLAINPAILFAFVQSYYAIG